MKMKRRFLGILLTLVLVLGLMPGISIPAYADGTDVETPLTLEAITAGTIVVKNPKIGMQYALNGGEKTKVTSDSAATIDVAVGDKVAFYGNGTEITQYGSSGWSAGTQISSGTADCYVYGNVMSLVDETGFATATVLNSEDTFTSLFARNTKLFSHSDKRLVLPALTLANNCYRQMFSGCTGLTTAPALPAETLANYCYWAMFQGCTELTTAPELPATTLAESCYQSMFSGCTKLTATPALSATTLAKSCCSQMFHGCTGLTTASALPATTLAESCYYAMFASCTKLTAAPALPATTLASNCYNSMFNGCTGLTAAPSLPAETLAISCYYRMFYGCTGLTAAPALPATTLASNCYYQMFNGCTGLTTAPELPATTLADYCYSQMFALCTGLTVAPELPATTLAKSCYYGMFSGCTGLTAAPELPATTLANSCYQSMFQGCTGLTAAPALPATELASSCYYSMFYNCTELTEAPALPATELASSCYSQMFYGCEGLTAAPALPAETLADSCYENMFRGCKGLTAALALPATTLANYCYSSMFQDCTGLTVAPELPATILASSCYYRMFYNCTELTEAPALPAITLANYCYSQMFSGCTKLTTAPALPATTLTNYCYYWMFYGCTSLTSVTCLATDISANSSTNNWLKGVSGTGTFTKAPTMTSWDTGANGIPSGWTVQTPHTHSFTYTADGATITATCSAEDCPLTESKATLTIGAPTMTVYQETGKSEVASLTGLQDFNTATGKSLAVTNIKYVGRDGTEYTESTTAPTNAGKYTATITLSGVKTAEGDDKSVAASVDYSIKYAVTFNTNGGSAVPQQLVEAGESATRPTDPTREGNIFGGWFADADFARRYVFDDVTENTTVYAKWGEHRVTWTVGEYSLQDVFTGNAPAADSNTMVNFAAEINKPEGATFEGWKTETDVSGDVTHTAQFSFPVTLNVNGGTINAGNVESYIYGTGATLPTDVTRAKYDFGGWFDNSGLTGTAVTQIGTTATGSKEFWAKWTEVYAVPATVTANSRTYDGTEKPLVTVTGTATGGEMQYALGTETEATEDYTTTIPSKTDVGTYYVWYKVIGDANHNDTAPDKVAVTITQADAPEVTAPTLTAVTYDPAKTLADIDLPEGWEWVTDTIVPAVVNNGYEAMCLVNDGSYDYTGITGYDAQLHAVIRTVPLTVNKADPLSEAVPAELVVCSSDLIYVHGTAGQEYIIVLKGTNVTPESWENKTVPDSGNDYLVAFENLSAATEYDVYTRISETANYKAGDAVNTPVCTTIDYTELDFDSDLVGATLTVRPYPDNKDYTYKWYRDDRTYYNDDSYQSSLTEIAGVQGNTYTFTADDCGKYIAVKIFVADSEVGDTDFGPIGYGKVLFDSKGGSEVSPVTGLSYGSKVTKPADPEKEGYFFAGWYEDEEYDEEYLWNFDTDTVMWQETTLYAKWVASEKELPYKDVKEIIAKNNGRKPYYYRHLQFLYDHNIMTGLKPDLFGVGAYLTREQAATLLYRYAGSPAVNSDGNPFPDVKKPSHWAYNAIVWAKANGVITGYTAGPDKGMFGPADDITREQFMVILWRWTKTSGYDITPDSDATYKAVADSNKLSTWAVEAVNWGYEKGIIGNKSLFKPQDNLTREDAATMLHRYIEVVSNLSKA